MERHQRGPLPRNRRTDAFERHVEARLNSIAPDGGSLVVACSGGPDSIAALVATTRVTSAGRIVAAHFDHRWRPSEETRADAAFVETLAAKLGATFVLGRADEPLAGDEASARDARYRWLGTTLAEAGATVAVTGHTRDDQAETVLLNLVRGGGLRAASGMASVARWPIDDPRWAAFSLTRPLLHVSRAEIEAYLEALGVEARVDPTNELATYARNRVRREVLPALEAVNRAASAHLAAFAERARADDEALDAWASQAFDAHGLTEEGVARYRRRRLSELPPAIAQRVVSILARRIGVELNAAQRQELVAIASRRGARLDLSGGHARSEADWLVVEAGAADTGWVDVGRRTD